MLAGMGNEQAKNPAFMALVVIGAVAVAVGAITCALGAYSVQRAERVQQYATALAGFPVGADGVAQAQLWVWVGVALIAVGIVMLVASLIIRAAR